MAEDGRNSVILPGSGTDGVTQLTRLSNVRKPGQWMFRVDGTRVEPCPASNMQPPYCEQPSLQPPRAPGKTKCLINKPSFIGHEK